MENCCGMETVVALMGRVVTAESHRRRTAGENSPGEGLKLLALTSTLKF